MAIFHPRAGTVSFFKIFLLAKFCTKVKCVQACNDFFLHTHLDSWPSAQTMIGTILTLGFIASSKNKVQSSPDFSCEFGEGGREGDLSQVAGHKGGQPRLQVVGLLPRQVAVNIVW